MTLPYERTRSVEITDRFLTKLLTQPRVPQWIREQARTCGRHFPMKYDMERLENLDYYLMQQPTGKLSRDLMKILEQQRNEK